MKYVSAIALGLILAAPASAQTSPLAPPACPAWVRPVAVSSQRTTDNGQRAADKPFGRSFWTSTAVFWIGAGADVASTEYVTYVDPTLMEGNPVVRDARGNLSRPKKAILTGALYGGTLAMERKWPRVASISRYAMGAVWFAAAAWNLTGARAKR